MLKKHEKWFRDLDDLKNLFWAGRFADKIVSFENSIFYPPLSITRSPWTAMLAPIKVDEIAQNWKTFLHAKNIQNWCKFLGIGTLCLYRCQNGSKKPLFFSHSTARWNHGSKWNPVMMKHNDPLYQPRYHLSGLIQRIWSYLATTKACPTGYFLLAPIY